MRRPLRIGVVGVGALGWHHARHLAAMPEARLVGVYDIRLDRARAVATSLGTTAFSTREELLAEVDGVTVAVPTPAHGEVGLAALAAGIPVLMEKPMAATLAEANQLVAAARATGTLLQIGHIERFNPAIRAAAAFVRNPLFIEGERLAPFQPRGTDVPVVLDLMIHDLDIVLHLAGGALPREVSANGAAVLSPLLDVAHARVEFDNGLVASVTASRIAQERVRRIRVYQEEGFLALDLATGRGEFLRLRDRWLPGAATTATLSDIAERIPLEAHPADALRLELASFIEAALGGGEAVVTAEQGRNALALALQVTDAIRLSSLLATPDP